MIHIHHDRDAAVLEAKRLAEQFIKDVNALEEYSFGSGKRYATVKRRSMDLSNALANIRKSVYCKHTTFY